jgi:beta-glucosidase-like glycosyl hydrolase
MLPVKKITSFITALIFTILILSVGCARLTYKPGLTFGPGEMNWVNRTIRKMTIEEKVGQMVACEYSGIFTNSDSDYLKELKALIKGRKVGCFIIFGGDVYETAQLTNTMQKWAEIPLLIASDFERGVGNQISGATLFPPLMSLGAAGSEELAYRMGKITAEEGRALGIHVTYAPVVDVNINPDNPIINTRSVGEDPELVGRITTAFIRGVQENGMIATAKHFPGHGDTDQDSHSLLPVILAERQRMEQVELYTFKKAIQAGVQAVMTAHIFVPSLDPSPGLPATLSPLILTEIRENSSASTD